MGGIPHIRREAILGILRVDRKHSAREIESRLGVLGHAGVTRRTLERDLASLAEEGEIVSDSAKPRGYRRAPNQPLSLRRTLTPSEAMIFRLAETHLGHLLPGGLGSLFDEVFKAARKTSGSDASPGANSRVPVTRWPDKVLVLDAGIPRISPRISPVVQATVSEALLLEQKLHIDYWSQYKQQQSIRTVNPLGLVQRGRSLYLVATSDQSQTAQTFAMHRISRARLLEFPALVPKGFTLKEWVNTDKGMQYGQKHRIDLELTVAPALIDSLRESPLDNSQSIAEGKDGWATVRANVMQSPQLEQWLLSMGPLIVVHQPIELREDIRNRIGQMSALYGAHPKQAPASFKGGSAGKT